MKKIVFVFIALFAICFTANAQQATCKVKGTEASVVVTVTDWDAAGNVYLSFDSDCDHSVNVSYTIKFCETTKGSPVKGSVVFTSQPFNALVAPNQSTPKTAKINLSGGKELTAVKEVVVSGARCE